MHHKRMKRNGNFDLHHTENDILFKQGKARCAACKNIKELSEFNNDKTKNNGKQNNCKECYRKKRKLIYKDKKELFATQQIKRKYGLSKTSLDELYRKQNNCCAICGRLKREDEKFCIDHNHRTGKVRGLLCANCNLGIGHFNDDIFIMQRVIEYLRREIDEETSND